MPASICVSIAMCMCVYICVLSIGLFVGGLSGGRSVYMFACLSASLFVVNLAMCLFACLCLSIYVCLSIFLSLCLSVCLLSVGRSVVSLSELSVSHSVHERAGSGGEDAESESGRLRTQERQVGLMNVELRTGAESRGLRARS